MINLLTKIRDYVKLLLPNDQKPLLLSNIQPDQKEVASENTGFVSPSENIPAENKQSSLIKNVTSSLKHLKACRPNIY